MIRKPFRGVGRPVAFLASGVLIQLGVLPVVGLPWMLFVPVSVDAILLAVFVPLAAVALTGPVLTAAQHGRFRTRLGVEIPAPFPGGAIAVEGVVAVPGGAASVDVSPAGPGGDPGPAAVGGRTGGRLGLASGASVFASPGYRPAIRCMASPGR
ncbi:hypothetical protein ABZ719_35155 [Streptomyces sp. NPDC006743]|uniref:hypothetical protein n=1 Tax=Streptomyces sp. NPDC006743 TaxID=3154480 RepID=UPI003454BEA7